MRARLIFNPNATTTSAAVSDALTGLLAAEVDLDVVGTTARGHATALAREAAVEGVDAVFSLGGDGTANEVMQGIAGTDVALGVLPGGATNVLARALGLPNDPRRAAELQLGRLLHGVDDRLGLGEANGRLFGFQAGVGFDAAIVRRVEDAPRLKHRLHQLAFVLLGLREWATGSDRRDPAVRITAVDGRPGAEVGLPAGPQLLVVAGNVDPYTFLGSRPLRLTPDASPATGLDLLSVAPVSTLRLLRALARAFTVASHASDPLLASAHDVHSCTISSDRPVDLMVDGEHLGRTRHVELRHRPDLLRTLSEPPLSGQNRAHGAAPQVA